MRRKLEAPLRFALVCGLGLLCFLWRFRGWGWRVLVWDESMFSLLGGPLTRLIAGLLASIKNRDDTYSGVFTLPV